MAANTIGQARIQLVPDLTGFHRRASKEIRQLPDIEAKVKLVADTDSFKRSVQRELFRVRDLEVVVRVVPDLSNFRRTIETALRRQGGQSINVAVDADLTAFRRNLQASMAGIPPIVVDVDADTALAAARLALLSRTRRSTINVDADTGLAMLQMGLLAGATGVTGIAARGASASFLGMGMSAVMAGVSGAAAITLMGIALVGVIGLVGIAAGAIGILGVGLLGLGVAAVPALGAIALGFDGIKRAAGEAKVGFEALKTAMSSTLEETMRPGFAALGSLLQEIIPQAQNVGRAFGEVFTGVSTLLRDDLMGELRVMMDGMAEFFRASLPGLETMITGFMNLGAVFGQFAGPIGAGFGQMMGELGAVFTRLEAMGTLQALMASFGPVLASTGALVGALVEGLALAGQIMAPILGPLLDSMTAILPGLGAALGAVGSALSSVLIALMPIFGPLSALLIQIAPILATALVPVADALVGIVTMLAPLLSQYVAIIAPILTNVLVMVADVFVALMPMIEVFLGLLAQMAPIFVQLIGQVANLAILLAPVLTQLITQLAPIIPVLAQAFMDVIMALMPLMPELTRLAMDLMPVLAFVVQNVVIPAIRFLAWFIIPFLVLAVRGVLDILGKFVGFLVDVKDWLIRAGQSAKDFGLWIGEMSREVRAKGENVIGWFRELPDRIRGYMDNAGQWLSDVGGRIVDGLRNGILNKGNVVKEAILSLVPDAIEGPIRKALGIQSPSRLMMEVGEYTGQGMAVGLENTIPDIQAASTRLAAAADPSTPAGAKAPVGTPAIPEITPVAPIVGAVAPVETSMAPVDTTGMVDAMAASLTDVATPAWESFGTTVAAVQETMLTPATTAAAISTTSMAGTMAAAAGMTSTSFATMAGSVGMSLAAANASTLNTGTTMANTVNGTIIPTWSVAGNHIRAVQSGPVETAFRETRNSLMATANTFGPATGIIANQWSGVREATAAPVRYTISNVFNDGVVGMWNSVSDLLGTTKMGAYPVRFASGGVMPGYTPGRDVHKFVSPTGGGLELSGGEAIMRPEWTRAVGGPAAVEAMNRGAIRGNLPDDQRKAIRNAHYKGGVMAFAAGGVVGAMTNIVKQKYPQMILTSGQRNSADNHGRGLAGDFAYPGAFGPHPAQLGLANDIANTYPGSMELIYGPGFKRQIKNGSIVGDGGGSYGFYAGAGDHSNHVHWAMNTPPTLPFGGGVFAGGSDGGGSAISMEDMLASAMKPFKDKTKAALDNYPKQGGIIDQYPIKMNDSLNKAADAKIKKLTEAMVSVDPGGAGVERWRPLAMQALARHGYNPAEHIDKMLKQIQIESGGNPNIINNWDSNAARGTPSGGLLQVIEPTFQRVRNRYPEAFRGLANNHLDPLANLTGGVGAVRMDWGGPAGRWPTTGGYDAGGWLEPGITQTYNGFKKPEAILTPAESERFIGITDAFLENGGGGGQYVGQHVENQYVTDVDEVQAKTRRGVRRAMKEAGVRG